MHVLHEDKNFLIVEKPARQLILPIPKSSEKTLRDELIDQYPELREFDPERAGISHRLDRDTSGLILIARNKNALRFFQGEFGAHRVKKEYIALVHGVMKDDDGVIDVPLGRAKSGKIVPYPHKKKEREARTEYTVIQRINGKTLVAVRPLTGRTHQIRTHLAAIGHPVVGDSMYGTKDKASRLMLHARKLEFYDLDAVWRSFESPLPEEFNVKSPIKT